MPRAKHGYQGHLGRSSSLSVNAGGVPCRTTGGDTRKGSNHPIHQSHGRGKAGVNGSGKGPMVSQDKPRGQGHNPSGLGYTARKIAVQEGRRDTVA